MLKMMPIGDENRPSRRPYVNYALITINIIVFFYFYIQGLRKFYLAILNYGAIPINILSGRRLETLFTSMFMHADIMHLLGNMLYLWVFGDNVEDALDHAKYLIFYLFGGLFASLAHIASTILSIYINPIPYVIVEMRTPAVGASGAISAVLGAYMLMYPRSRIRTLVFYIFITIVSVPAYYYLGFWFIYQMLMGIISLSGILSGVAFWAHIGGFIFGLIIVKAFGIKPRKRAPPPEERRAYRPIVAPWVRSPLVDLYVEADRVIVMAYMPGVEEDDIRVSVSEWDVVIEAEHGDVRFYRHLVLPVPIIPKIVDLSYRNGVLSFTLYRLTYGL
ncbi:MAG: rhomboid family intramembrane serine protease [Candidatus Bathyarchaeota archaeon]|nr:rhomboid family intramembrane serine protease [Candidatus Bathyarchaeota archaeon]